MQTYKLKPAVFLRQKMTKKSSFLRTAKTSKERRKLLEKRLGKEFTAIGRTSLKDEDVYRSCENFIGATQVPLGVAGPLKVDKKEYFIPLATTEAAFIASVGRGCKAISESGGAKAKAEKIGITRAPVFLTKGPGESQKLALWVKNNAKRLARVARKTSKYLTLIDVEPQVADEAVFLRFRYDPSDAMGMNMATIATQDCAQLIEKETNARLVSLAGNFDVDKKPSFLNFARGRGFRVWTTVLLPREVVRKVLKTTPKALQEVYKYKIELGSALAGTIGANAQIANVAASFFIATGQDVAHVSEVAIGTTSISLDGDNLRASVFLPDLPLGTVGGGTGLPTQREALSILGAKSSSELAKVFAAACLAAEVSLLASLAEGSLARAHKELAWGGN